MSTTGSRLPPIPWRRTLRRARRSCAVWLFLSVVLAAGSAVRASQLDAEAVARRDAWGQAVPVVVAVADLEAGAVVRTGDVTVERRPAPLVPRGALGELPVGRVVTASILAGEVVVAARIAPGGLSGAATLVGRGHRAVAVPVTGGAPPLSVGDRVDVVATFDAFEVEALPSGVVAAGVVVVHVDTDAGLVTVAVAQADVPRVAFATARGVVSLALLGG